MKKRVAALRVKFLKAGFYHEDREEHEVKRKN